MQNRPDPSTLLDAVASFLIAEVVPKLEAEKALQFRVMIAANVASVVAGELRTEDDRFAAESRRLTQLVPEAATGALTSVRRGERLAALAALDAALVEKLRATGTTPQALEHLWQTAKETLAVTNPRFEQGEDP